ncbi:glycosyltransferase family 2 protein [uncultured Methanobrevibacter sp.]|uniref:glycosyltransferase family 2 protein n=1 Tax=uncultured Methanobrevibacter sp. TaxID=253161 RepID=UPI0025F2CD96|nr:glycosyltransferase [uncultured Methanobrevibacter sp.]
MVKVSVIIPVYNVEDYLQRCLDSIIYQTLDDIEIICINDESTDSSLEILKEYAKRDNRIIIKSQENQGLSGARNHGIRIASGEYYYFIDSDDWIELDALEKLYYHAVSNDSEIVFFNFIEHLKSNKTINKIYLPVDKEDYSNFVFDYTYNKRLVMNNQFVVWNKFFKASLIKDNNLIFHFRLFEDFAFHVETLFLAKKVSYLPEILHHYNRLNQDSLQNKKTSYNKRLVIFDVFDLVEEILIKYDKVDEFKTNFAELKINESYANFNLLSQEFREEYYNKMRDEFLKMELDSDILSEIPYKLYKFYIFVINFNHIEIFDIYKENIRRKTNFIDKKQLSMEISNFNELGIDSARNSKLPIISLTSFPERMDDIQFCIYSLLNQNLKAKKVILYLAEEQFPNKEDDIPKHILKFKDNGLTIKWYKDIRSYKKLIPALQEYPNDYIVTADDDIFYPPDWLENMWQTYNKHPNTIVSCRSRAISLSDNGEIEEYANWHLVRENPKTSFLNFPTGSGGILYFPNSLSKTVLNEDLFKKLCPLADDIWFWTMAVLNDTKITAMEKNYNELIYVNVARQLGLTKSHTLWAVNQEGGNDSQLENILQEFPEILDKIKESEN